MKLTTRLLALTAVNLAGTIITPIGGVSAAGTTVVAEGESIQDAIDAAGPGTTVVVKGHHVENVWIDKSNIKLVGRAPRQHERGGLEQAARADVGDQW